MAGYPMVIVFRAFSHIFFGTLGALYLQKFPDTLDKPKASWIFNFVLALVHALAEVLACIVFLCNFQYQCRKYVLCSLCASWIWHNYP